MWHVWEAEEVHTGNRRGDATERDHLEDRRRWEDNIKVYFEDVGWEGMDSIALA
jgi:hypothetical protein